MSTCIIRWFLSLSTLLFVLKLGSSASSTIPSPAFGAGTEWFGSDNEEMRSSHLKSMVLAALSEGYTHIDCAQVYHSYKSVGRALHQFLEHSGNTREDVFITDKLWNTHHTTSGVREALDQSLHDLNTSYIDLLLIHYPVAWTIESDLNDMSSIELFMVSLEETWLAMEALVDEGLVRHIGVSNFNVQQLLNLFSIARIKPIANQIECHPHLVQHALWQTCKDHDVDVLCYGPLVPLRAKEIQGDEFSAAAVANSISRQRTDITPGQVLLRYIVQQGFIPVTTTSNLTRMIDNHAIFDLDLSVEEMSAFGDSSMTFYRHFNPKGWKGVQDEPFFNQPDVLHSEI